MEGLMLISPGCERRNCRNKDGLLNGNERAGVYTYLISGFQNWRRVLFRLKRDFLSNQLRRSLRSSWQS
jgi:hypothetical protein